MLKAYISCCSFTQRVLLHPPPILFWPTLIHAPLPPSCSALPLPHPCPTITCPVLTWPALPCLRVQCWWNVQISVTRTVMTKSSSLHYWNSHGPQTQHITSHSEYANTHTQSTWCPQTKLDAPCKLCPETRSEPSISDTHPHKHTHTHLLTNTHPHTHKYSTSDRKSVV